MVWFACRCGETLKKKQVDSHAKWCSECWSVSCIDCGVSFPGDDYASHNQCITESEKYEKGYGRGGGKHSETNKNGSVKSKHKLSAAEAWACLVADAAFGAPSRLQGPIERLNDFRDAVPRQKSKFINFVRNSLNIRSDNTIQVVVYYYSYLCLIKTCVDRVSLQSGRGMASSLL